MRVCVRVCVCVLFMLFGARCACESCMYAWCACKRVRRKASGTGCTLADYRAGVYLRHATGGVVFGLGQELVAECWLKALK